MKVYESIGTFSPGDETFTITIQTTNISPDTFFISQWYNICNAGRYAVVGILQTEDKDDTDFSNYPANAQIVDLEITFGDLDSSYLVTGDRDIYNITSSDTITVYIHDGIGFDPTTNNDDNHYIQNYKLGITTHLASGSPPGVGNEGIMV